MQHLGFLSPAGLSEQERSSVLYVSLGSPADSYPIPYTFPYMICYNG